MLGNLKGRRLSYAMVVVALALVAGPAIGATSPGSIRITEPVASSAHGGTVGIEWSYRPGTEIRSTSKVNVFWTPNGLTWGKIASSVPIRTGGVEWNSAGINAPVAFRVAVVGTTIKSTVSPVLIDNTKPTVDIVRPTTNQVIVEDAAPGFAIVAGSATLSADARDGFTGIAEVRWLLDGKLIGTGANYKHNFGNRPGQHVLTAVAVDRAGNTAEDSVDIMALPGPSNAGQVPELPAPPSEGPALPETPDLPDGTPEVPEVPNPDPSEAPDPTPSDDPAPPVDPTQLIPSEIPSP